MENNQGKKPRTTTRRIFTLHYHGQIGYKATHLVTSNSHTMSNTFGHTHHTSLSHLDSDKTLTLQKNENFLLTTTLLTQANVRYNESSKILPRFEQIQSHSQKYSVFSLWNLTQYSHLKRNFFNHTHTKTKCLLFLNNFEQTVL